MEKYEIICTCPVCGGNTWHKLGEDHYFNFECCNCGEEVEAEQMGASARMIPGSNTDTAVKTSVPYIDRVIQVIEGCGWECKRNADGTELMVIDKTYSFGRYCFTVPLDDDLNSHIFRHFKCFSTGKYMQEMEEFLAAHPEYTRPNATDFNTEAWNIKQLLRKLMYTVNSVPKEDKPLRFWMRAGMSFMLNETEMNELRQHGQICKHIILSKIWGNQVTLDGDSYADSNIGVESDDNIWMHDQVDYDFTPRKLLSWQSSKRFWMRAGISMMLTSTEFAKVIQVGHEGEEIIHSKFDAMAFELDGESYSPANMNETSEDVWKHEEINFDF